MSRFPTALHALYHWEKNVPDQPFLRQPVNGQWKEYTWKQAAREIRSVAAFLKSLDLPPGSGIALLSKNCAHWIMADLAIGMAGHVSVPIYPTLSAHGIRPILEHSEARAIFIGKLDDYSTQAEAIAANLVKISFPLYGINEGHRWDDILSAHAPLAEDRLPDANDLFTIMYTSGTTGKPKGVMYNYFCPAYIIDQVIPQLEMPEHAHFFSYLPLCHIAERAIVETGVIFLGGTVSFTESIELFSRNLQDVQPDVFFAVPRIWAKFQEGILGKMPQEKLDKLLRIPILNGIVRKKIKKGIGLSRAILILSGAAPIPVSLLEWYKKLGVNIQEGYAMTEDCCYSHVNRRSNIRIGTVGQRFPEIDLRISEEGEIQIRHKALMLGYYKEPELTKQAFTDDGYLKTGDKGSVDKDGFLKITGRVKDLFKTDKGKYIAPAPIEMKIMANPDVDQVCVVGMGIPQPIALVVLSPDGKKKDRQAVASSLTATLNSVNPNLESFEKLQKAVIMKEDWTVPNGLLTPTLKVKRNEIEKIHLPRYPHWYAKEGLVVDE
jgi:long-chain acyl-CoA synthetase